jgi:hypothetical protein
MKHMQNFKKWFELKTQLGKCVQLINSIQRGGQISVARGGATEKEQALAIAQKVILFKTEKVNLLQRAKYGTCGGMFSRLSDYAAVLAQQQLHTNRVKSCSPQNTITG